MADSNTLTNQNVEKIKEMYEKELEIKELKIQNLTLTLEKMKLQLQNKELQKSLTTALSQDHLKSVFISKKDRFIDGFEKFIERVDPRANIYPTYEGW